MTNHLRRTAVEGMPNSCNIWLGRTEGRAEFLASEHDPRDMVWLCLRPLVCGSQLTTPLDIFRSSDLFPWCSFFIYLYHFGAEEGLGTLSCDKLDCAGRAAFIANIIPELVTIWFFLECFQVGNQSEWRWSLSDWPPVSHVVC